MQKPIIENNNKLRNNDPRPLLFKKSRQLFWVVLHPMEFYIETERLILRDILSSDREGMFILDSNPDVHRYLGNHPISSIEEVDEIILKIRSQYRMNGIGRWAVIEKNTGEFIGWSGLKYITEEENNRTHFYDVGYRFLPAYWGKGYATESAKAALDYGFRKMNIEEIIGTCHEENKASRRALEKCGLTFVEQFLYMEELKCDWLRITRKEWERVQSLNRDSQ